MMEYLVIACVAFTASTLTFFSGFGLGTLLTPFFALFFPVSMSVALTALVHFLNNLFKLGLVWRHFDKTTVVHFGITAMIAAAFGAKSLIWLSSFEPLFSYSLFGRQSHVLPVKLVTAILIIGFVFVEILPSLRRMTWDRKFLPVGGLLSGFFGGLSGHQGALRSMFLVRLGLSKENFIATGVVIACMIDVTRISIYAEHFSSNTLVDHSGVLLVATSSAFCGAYLGSKLLKKFTMGAIQNIVTIMLLAIAVGLGSGFI